MHVIAGTMAIISLIWLFPKWIEAINQDWKSGIGFTAGIAMSGYMLGCFLGLILNLIKMLFSKS
tara:strand:+ start:2109 stop:2300 length:192 start_codon:yes stop_codon:yes gene_type:complete